MKRFSAFLLIAALIFSYTACSVIQNPSVENLPEGSVDSVESTTRGVEPEEINQTGIAQQAYDLIDSAELLCKSGMQIISTAWHFGIWEAPECTTDVVMEHLSARTGFDVSFIEEHGGYTADELVSGDGNFANWEFCLTTAENCLSAAGVYSSVNESLDAAKDLIRKIPDDNADYRYLKDYYTKVATYVAYFEDVSGSYNDLTEAIAEYESNIQVAKEPLLFDFG